MKLFTIGYGGRSREEFIQFLRDHGVKTVVDVRLRPDRASMGIWVKSKGPDTGIEKTLAGTGIAYCSLIELGNVFIEFKDWREPYRQLMEQSGELLVSRLASLPGPLCLLCAEKRVAECHRELIAAFLSRTRGWEAHHLE